MRNTDRAVWMGLARLATHLSREVGRAVEEASRITLTEMTLMGLIRASGGRARMVDLSHGLQVSKPAVTKVADGLEKKGFICRENDPDDRRVNLLVVTSAGQAEMEPAEKSFQNVLQAELWDRLSDDESAFLATVFRRLQKELGLAQTAVLPPGDP